jgi:hypothetical protein
MSLKGRIPERTKETARMVVRAVVEKIKRLLEQRIRQAVMGALNRKEHSPLPNAASIDWKWTIGRNLKNYQPSLGTIVPEKVYFYSRAQRSNNWTVIVCMDQSGSMAESVVYGSVTGSIFASLPALNTRVVAFDTEVVDLTEQCGSDPVDMIFGVQLGGGTDINKAVAYCEKFITDPNQTIFFLISDLIEGGNQSQLIRRMHDMVASGVRVDLRRAGGEKTRSRRRALLRLHAEQTAGTNRRRAEETGPEGAGRPGGGKEGEGQLADCHALELISRVGSSDFPHGKSIPKRSPQSA